MIRVALRGIATHPGHFVLSILAVALGAAFAVGTFAFRGMLSTTFDAIVESTYAADAYVRGSHVAENDAFDPGALSGGLGAATRTDGSRNLVPVSLAEDVARVDGVAHVAPDIAGPVVLIGADGVAVAAGASSTALAVDPRDPARPLLDGAWPEAGQIVLERSTVDASGLGAGDATTVVLAGEPREMTVSGTFAAESGGGVLVGIEADLAEELFAPDGMVPSLAVRAQAGTDPAALAHDIAAILPDDASAEAVTGERMREDASRAIEETLGFVELFLLLFAAISLIVGAFIIANTFAMSVRERTREFALLLAVGVPSSQVLASVLLQALVVGLVGAGLGVLAGPLLVQGIGAVLARLGMETTGDTALGAVATAAMVLVGAVTSVAAAAGPALRAAAVPPVQAMREDLAPDPRAVVRGPVGFAVAVAGAGLLVLASRLGSSTDGSTTGWAPVDGLDPQMVLWVGAGAVLGGVLLASPAFTRQVLSVVAAPLVALLGPVGRLAGGNVTRNPRRTANTAGTLLIGMALVSLTGVIAASTQESVRAIVDDEVIADLVVGSPTRAVPDGAVDTAASAAGVEDLATDRRGTVPVAEVAASSAASRDQGTEIGGVPATFFRTALDPVVLTGDPHAALASGGVVVNRVTARDRGWEVGDVLLVGEPSSAVRAEVGAVVDARLASDGIVVADDVFDAVVPVAQRTTRAAYVVAAPGTALPELRATLVDAVAPYLVVSVQDREETGSEYASRVNDVLAVLYGMLALSIVIAFLGIANTMALSIGERTREIGLMLAIGLGRGQLAAIIAIESVLTTLYGTALGVAVGIGIGSSIPGVLADQGLNTLAIPWGQVFVVLGVSVVIGLVASVWPAVRASRLPVLDAIAAD